MKRCLVAALCCFCAPAVHAQDKVFHRDPAKGVVEVSGTIQSESINQVVVKVAGKDLTISSLDVVDGFYQLAAIALRQDYRRADNAEKTGDKALAGSAERRKAYIEAMAEYQKLVPRLAGLKFLDRHAQYKIAILTAKLAPDDKAQLPAAVALLQKYRKEHPNWQVVAVTRELALLHRNAGDFPLAVAAWDALKAMPGASSEIRIECEIAALGDLRKAGQADQSLPRLQAVLPLLPKTDPRNAQLEILLLVEKARSSTMFQAAMRALENQVAVMKDQRMIAFAYNALGDAYLSNNQPKDALYQYLYVDLIYNQDRGEHLRALGHLKDLFEQMKQPDRAREYGTKLDKLQR